MENQEINFTKNVEISNRESILQGLYESHEILNGLTPETPEHFETKALLTKVKNLLTKTI